MPIYAYRCEACGFAKDVLQKMSDEPLSVCPECQQASFKKQITAAGFQLKGSGWYVTDFRGGSTSTGAAGGATAASPTEASTSTSSDSTSSDSTSSNTSTSSTTADTKAA